jgi:hypothetical protein
VGDLEQRRLADKPEWRDARPTVDRLHVTQDQNATACATLPGVKLRDIAAIIPTREPRAGKKSSRLAAWRARIGDRMARSSRVFFFGLVIACGVEVLVDWNQTLTEINFLRNAIQQKGEAYVGILSKSSDDELAAREVAGLDRLSHGIFDDQDAIYVRYTDRMGAVVWDKLKTGFAETFQLRGFNVAFAEHYARLMQRDTRGILQDPEGFKARVAGSRYADFAQSWTDTTAKALALVVPPKPTATARGQIVYEDRLRGDNREKDDAISYAIGTVLGDDGKNIGTVIVAFDMTRTNNEIRFKYMKFTALVVFFVALILLQNTMSRKNKLRLLDMEARYASARKALRDTMPQDHLRCGTLFANGVVDQTKGSVGGMAWSAAAEGDCLLVLVVDPDGNGIDAAAVGLQVIRTFLDRRKTAIEPTLEHELRALGQAAAGIPLTRPIGTLLLRVNARTGAYHALSGSFALVRVLGGAAPEEVEFEPSQVDSSEAIVGPLLRASGTLEPGRSMVWICSSAAKRDAKAFGNGVADYIGRKRGDGKDTTVEDAVEWVRRREPAMAEHDIAIVAVTRPVKA